MKLAVSFRLVWFALLAASHVSARGFVAGDHLVPVQQVSDAQSPEAAYERLWRQKLLVTPGEIARSVHLPGNVGVKTAVSVYRSPLSRGEYRVTATQTSASLWRCVAPDAPQPVNPDSIEVARLEAALPETTALAVQKVWRVMLLDVREPPASNEILLEGSTEIFSAVAANGQSLIGQFQGLGQRNTAALSTLANLLLQYCDSPETRRVEIAHRIEKAASDLVGRVASSSGNNSNVRKAENARNRKHESDASNLISIRTLGLVNSSAVEPHLGSSIDDFRSLWGPPSAEESLSRTANFQWNRRPATGEPIVSSVFAVEVAFLDGIACEITLRSNVRITPTKLKQLAKPFLPAFRNADFAKPKSDLNGFLVCELSDGTFVLVNKHEGHSVIVIRGQCYSRNEDVFDREAAKVRPPTSNH